MTLKDIHPPVWRRLQVPDLTLAELHRIIQPAMGWKGYHLHAVIISGVLYGEPESRYNSAQKEDYQPRLSQVITQVKSKFLYVYDFSDDWRHQIPVEKILPPTPGGSYPNCLTSRRVCPLFGADKQSPWTNHRRACGVCP